MSKDKISPAAQELLSHPKAGRLLKQLLGHCFARDRVAAENTVDKIIEIGRQDGILTGEQNEQA